jgi:hypothetical protein
MPAWTATSAGAALRQRLASDEAESAAVTRPPQTAGTAVHESNTNTRMDVHRYSWFRDLFARPGCATRARVDGPRSQLLLLTLSRPSRSGRPLSPAEPGKIRRYSSLRRPKLSRSPIGAWVAFK